MRILARELLYQFVHRLFFIAIFQPRPCRILRNKHDFRFRQFHAHRCHKLLEIRKHLFRRFSRVDIIPSATQ